MGRGKAWTVAEDGFLRDSYGRIPLEDIGRCLGRSPQAVMSHWNKTHSGAAQRREERRRSIERYYGRMHTEEIAVKLGLSSKSVSNTIREMLVSGRLRPLTQAQVDAIPWTLLPPRKKYAYRSREEQRPEPAPSPYADERPARQLYADGARQKRELEDAIADIEERMALTDDTAERDRLSLQRNRLACRLHSFMYGY